MSDGAHFREDKAPNPYLEPEQPQTPPAPYVHQEPLAPSDYQEPEAQGFVPAYASQAQLVPEPPDESNSVLLSWVIAIAFALVAAFLIRMFVFEPYVVPTGSMLETIQLGDQLIGEKVTYLIREPQCGDIVTFADPAGSNSVLIKRVIATAGQTVDLVDGQVVVDGEPLYEPYTNGKPSYPISDHPATLDEDITYPYVVPEGCVWVMGDNRTNSLDSRYFGPVRIDTITSRGVLIFWPSEHFGPI